MKNLVIIKTLLPTQYEMPVASASDDKVPIGEKSLDRRCKTKRDELWRIFARISRRFVRAAWKPDDDEPRETVARQKAKNTGCALRVVNRQATHPRVYRAFSRKTDREDTSALSLFAERVISRDVSILLTARIVHRWRCLPGELCSSPSWPNCGE